MTFRRQPATESSKDTFVLLHGKSQDIKGPRFSNGQMPLFESDAGRTPLKIRSEMYVHICRESILHVYDILTNIDIQAYTTQQIRITQVVRAYTVQVLGRNPLEFMIHGDIALHKLLQKNDLPAFIGDTLYEYQTNIAMKKTPMFN